MMSEVWEDAGLVGKALIIHNVPMKYVQFIPCHGVQNLK